MESLCTHVKTSNYWTRFLISSTSSLGITLLALHTWIPNYFFTSVFDLTRDSPILDMWLKNPMELNTDFYFFNWTNPEQFYNPDIKPKFNQLGPYRYRLNVEKVNVKWNDNNTITYNQLRRWWLIEEYRNACVHDAITTLNPVTLIAANSARNLGYIMKKTISLILLSESSNLYTTKTPQQILFDGLEHSIINIRRFLPLFAREIPEIDKFGWLRLVNGSETFEGVYNAANGIGGNFEMLSWNYHSNTPYFDGACSKVHGSPGELFNGKVSKGYIGFFAALLCRYIRLDFEREEVVYGVLGYKYSIGSGAMDNGTKMKGNDCYCNGKCIPSGMINLTSCRYGIPIYGSLPHYYAADPTYKNSVDGVNPENLKHETYVILEPKTGIPLKAVIRFQLNMLIDPIGHIEIVQDARKIYFPLFWLEQQVTIPDDMRTILNIYLSGPYVLASAGSALLFVGCSILLFKPLKILVLKLSSSKAKHESLYTQFKIEEMPLQHKLVVNE